MQISIDGPAGAGKSTIAKKLSQKLGFVYVDTGAFYRTLAYYFFENNINYEDIENIKNSLKNIKIDVSWENGIQTMFLNERSINDKIRTNEISSISSSISVHKEIRNFLIDIQREIANKNNVVMDGRDIGTVVLPNADYKFFLTASVEKRALRRLGQLRKKGETAYFKDVVREIKKRDYRDSTREIAPLKRDENAVLVDNSKLSLQKTIKKMLEIINKNED
ncbi:MAG: (d)CMP kinase [Oscillospiraceae bacterium]